MIKRIGFFTYGIFCYAVFFGTFLYAVGFVGNFLAPKSMDSEPTVPLGMALLTDLGLLGLFAVQHSVMARPGFKKRWTRIVPEPVERSTYVLLSSVAMIALFWFWQPLGGMVWDIENGVARTLMYALFAFGWGLVLVSTFLLNHFDLFGLRQVHLYLRGVEYTPLPFSTPLFYRYVRHPLYVGWFFAFWATPTMTMTHLMFAVTTAAYILVAIQLEEKDLVDFHGRKYLDYQENVPMLVPNGRKAPVAKAESLVA